MGAGDAVLTGSLFYGCPVPGCRNGITDDPARPCEDCMTLFGEHIRPASAPGPRRSPEYTVAMLAKRDEEVQAAYLSQLHAARAPAPERDARAGEWTDGQCWVCERQRKCRPDPSWRNLPICRSCGREELA